MSQGDRFLAGDTDLDTMVDSPLGRPRGGTPIVVVGAVSLATKSLANCSCKVVSCIEVSCKLSCNEGVAKQVSCKEADAEETWQRQRQGSSEKTNTGALDRHKRPSVSFSKKAYAHKATIARCPIQQIAKHLLRESAQEEKLVGGAI